MCKKSLKVFFILLLGTIHLIELASTGASGSSSKRQAQYYPTYYGSDSFKSHQCARIYQGPNFLGRSYTFNDKDRIGGGWHSGFNFVPQSVKVRPDCSLTMYDYYYWTRKSYRMDSSWTWDWYYPAAGACCDCGFCDALYNDVTLQCARLYEHAGCDNCDGYRLELKPGDKVPLLGTVDNRLSSVKVNPGCEVVAYRETSFQGERISFSKPVNQFKKEWLNQISSVECNCLVDSKPKPTYGPSTTTTTKRSDYSSEEASFLTEASWTSTTRQTTTTTRSTTTTTPKTTTTTPKTKSTTTTIDDDNSYDSSEYTESEESEEGESTSTKSTTTTKKAKEDDEEEEEDASKEIMTVPTKSPITTTQKTTLVTTTKTTTTTTEKNEEDDDNFFGEDWR